MTGGPVGPERREAELPDPFTTADELARHLIEHEANAPPEVAEPAPPGERVLRRLRQELARVLGAEGFAALEGRAFSLASRRYRFLGDGAGSPRSLDDARAGLAGRDPDEVHAALQAVCTHMIALLFTFLGEPLTTQLVRLAWPDLPGDDPAARERETR